MIAPAKAALIEIFDSVQGEGSYVGYPMAFVRVATCPLRCSYCDTPHSYAARSTFTVAMPDGVRTVPNPVAAADVARLLADLVPAARRPHRVSLTGGEPLVYPRFWRELGECLGADWPLHLETAAVHPRALAEVLPVLAHVSADYKLPETVGGADLGAEHVACVATAVAQPGVSVDVKVVLTDDCAWPSFELALQRLQPFRAAVVLILQPVTPFGAVREPVSAARLQAALARALDLGFTVRVLPQVHKQLAVP